MLFNWYDYILVALASAAAGAVNALAGGGTLISFPALIAAGIPPVAANITNTVALTPGYLGATIAQWDDLRTQKKRMLLYLPVGVAGGVFGGYLLLKTGEGLFRSLIPFLILFATLLLAISDPLRNWLTPRLGKGSPASMAVWALLPIGIAAIYGGYFGAGLSVIVLAVLGLMLSDSLTVLNALKQSISFCVNTAAAVFFLFSKNVVWSMALVMAGFALLGGVLGGRLAGRIRPTTLRRIVVAIGLVVSVIYFLK